VYTKRDPYANYDIHRRPQTMSHDEINEFRKRGFVLKEHGAMLANFIDPNVPYKS
jgi:hypothetical protein